MLRNVVSSRFFWLKGLKNLLGRRMEGEVKLPVVVVLGSTATGKSKLAIELALKFGGEVISADSMQVYKGLDILTNKATKEEMQGVPHHMISVVDRRMKYDVVQFRNEALPIVQRILEEGKMPVIVGGTNYYIESLLWEVLITEKKKTIPPVEEVRIKSDERSDQFEDPVLQLFCSKAGLIEDADVKQWSNQELYTALKIVDTERANRLHPNDRRKVMRSLQVRFQTGKKHSDIIAEQCDGVQEKGAAGKRLGGPLRFKNCLCLWIQADRAILRKRIEDRVENMIQLGLKSELDSYMDTLRNENADLNYEEGVLQSIGFKEFHSYLQLMPEDRSSAEGEKLFREGVEQLKLVTSQYARKQTTWVNQRFLMPHRRELPPVYALNGNKVDRESWRDNIHQPAIEIVGAYLTNNLSALSIVQKLVSGTHEERTDDGIARVCEVCDNRVFIGNLQWDIHLQSSRHKRMLKRKSSNPVSNKSIKYKKPSDLDESKCDVNVSAS